MPDRSPPLLEMRDVRKGFPGVQALDGVSLTAERGQVVALVGENGAGKSTLIKILSGAQPVDSGEILIDGVPAGISSPRDAEHHGIATVYQEFNLFPDLSVAENLFIGRYPKRGLGIAWRRLRREAVAFLDGLGVSLPADAAVGTLSVAEKQMLEIAKTLHRDVRILILDEPTAVLGDHDVAQLMRMVRQLRDRGVGVIFISHRLNEVFEIADTYVVLKDGLQADSGRVEDVDQEHIVRQMVGRELGELAPKESVSEHDVVLRVEGLSRRGVLHDVGLTVRAGEIVGIAGLRGAGRTELARAVFGADHRDEGSVEVAGEPVRARAPRDAIAGGIGLVPEERGSQGLFKNLSTAQNIPLVRMISGRSPLVRPRFERRLAERYVADLNIRLGDVGASVGTLSGGNQQKVVLAKWLEAGVRVLILDEPTRGIDIGSKREIYSIIRSLCDRGVGVLLISSELPEILEMSHRILVMQKGRIVAEVSHEEATEELVMSHAVGAAA